MIPNDQTLGELALIRVDPVQDLQDRTTALEQEKAAQIARLLQEGKELDEKYPKEKKRILDSLRSLGWKRPREKKAETPE